MRRHQPAKAYRRATSAARLGARMVFVCWRPVTENPWMKVPMDPVSPHLPPRPQAVQHPHAPEMFAFADPEHVAEVLTSAGWAPPRIDSLDLDLDIAAGGGCGSVDPNRRRQ